MNDFEKFKEEIPDKEKFDSLFTGKKIIGKDCELVLNVWNKFGTETMNDYHDSYLKCDVLLLANVLERNRNNSLKEYGLSPHNYLSEPALSWDTMFDITKVKLKLISDLDMYLFLKKVMRGGVSNISRSQQ